MCHEFTAVSQGYMHELFEDAQGLQDLIRQEHRKAHGIINGIDTEVWNPDGYNAQQSLFREL